MVVALKEFVVHDATDYILKCPLGQSCYKKAKIELHGTNCSSEAMVLLGKIHTWCMEHVLTNEMSLQEKAGTCKSFPNLANDAEILDLIHAMHLHT